MKIYPGGLYNCCIDTLHEHGRDGYKEGQLLNCQHCSGSMVWRDGWRWNQKGEFPGQTDLLKEASDGSAEN